MIQRTLDFDIARGNSCFLWGPRRTGKSTLLRQRFPDALYYDLLLAREFRRLSANPGLLREECESWLRRVRGRGNPIIIDEIGARVGLRRPVLVFHLCCL